ncbi:MAG: OmpH family outer membrane protein [Pyrinomonadaceae bacterium]
MKIDRLIAAFAFIAALSISPVLAQRPAAGQPATAAPQTSANVPDSKIAVIYSDAFLDDKTGIARFTTLLNTLNREFQPRQTELQQLQQKATTLNDEIEKTRTVADPRTLQQKADQLETYKVELKRKSEDAQQAYDKRKREIFGPLQDSIGKALEAFAKQRGITVMIDGSQVPVVYAADSIDFTRAFINDFNGKNPATASVTPPQ